MGLPQSIQCHQYGLTSLNTVIMRLPLLPWPQLPAAIDFCLLLLLLLLLLVLLLLVLLLLLLRGAQEARCFPPSGGGLFPPSGLVLFPPSA